MSKPKPKKATSKPKPKPKKAERDRGHDPRPGMNIPYDDPEFGYNVGGGYV